MEIEKWNIDGLRGENYNIYNVDIGEQLIVTMINEDGGDKFKIIFETFDTFSIADESRKLKILYETLAVRKGRGVFWKLKNSAQLADLFEQTLGFFDNLPYIHYAIYTEDYCIDIISYQPPVIQFTS